MSKKLTPAQQAAQNAAKKLGLNGLGGLTAPTTGGSNIYLPNNVILEEHGVSKAQIAQYVKMGLLNANGMPKALKIDFYAPGTNTTLTNSEALQASLDALPGPLHTVVWNQLGLSDARLGKTVSERISAITPALTAAQGHIGNIDLALAAASSTNAAIVKQNTYLSGLLSSGNEAALIGASAGAKYSAEANADSWLTNIGLDTPAMNHLVAGMVARGVTNQNELMQNVRASQAYKTAFPGLSEYNGRPDTIHMTESEYRTYSQSIQGAAQQYGGVNLNQAQIGKLLMGNVTAPEFQQRVQDIGAAVNNADPRVRAILQQQYGLQPGHLFAWYANPKEALPDLQRAVASSDIQDYAQRVGLGGLKPAGANQLADMAKLAATQGNQGLGYGVSQIEGGLFGAAKDAPLLASNPGQASSPLNTNALIGAQLPGYQGTSQVQAQQQVQRAEQTRVAPFEKGGGYAEDAKGVVGLGTAKA